jgi:hypothetical protein
MSGYKPQLLPRLGYAMVLGVFVIGFATAAFFSTSAPVYPMRELAVHELDGVYRSGTCPPIVLRDGAITAAGLRVPGKLERSKFGNRLTTLNVVRFRIEDGVCTLEVRSTKSGRFNSIAEIEGHPAIELWSADLKTTRWWKRSSDSASNARELVGKQ